MLRVIIVDDELLARQGLRDLLTEISEVEICGEASCIEEARELLLTQKPDGVFLDIRMPEMDGFSLFQQADRAVPVVFVTAYTEYALQAFEVNAVDYLLKPVRKERLETAVARLRNAAGNPSPSTPPYGDSDRICLRTPERTVVANLEEVLALEAVGDFTRFSLVGTPPILICQSLGVYERTLPKPPFLRLDRSLILNLSRIQSLEISPTRGANVFLAGAQKPWKLGRAALRRLKEAIPHTQF